MRSLTILILVVSFSVISCKCPYNWKEHSDDDYDYCTPTRGDQYGRGDGYEMKLGEFNLKGARKRCEKKHSGGCEQWGALIYPKCIDGYYNALCCICEMKNCPEGYTGYDIYKNFLNYDTAYTCRKAK